MNAYLVITNDGYQIQEPGSVPVAINPAEVSTVHILSGGNEFVYLYRGRAFYSFEVGDYQEEIPGVSPGETTIDDIYKFIKQHREITPV